MARYDTERGNKKLRFLDRYIGIPLVFLLGLFKLKKNSITLRTVRNAAFLETAAIGDTVLLSASIADFKQAYPDARLTLFTGSSNYETASLLSGINNVIKLPLKNPVRAIQVIKEAGLFDVWFDFGAWPRLNAILSSFSNATLKIGFKTPKQYRHYIYDIVIPHSSEVHEIKNYRNLMLAVGIRGNNLPCIALDAPVDARRVVIHMFPGGSRSYLKEWPAECWIELINFLTEAGFTIYITGASVDRQRALELQRQVLNKDSVIIAAGNQTLREVVKLLKSAIVVISVDTGIMHLASALRCNLISLHGPTFANRWGALNVNSISLQGALDCSPCLNLGFESDCNQNSCMKRISVKDVVKAFKKFVSI